MLKSRPRWLTYRAKDGVYMTHFEFAEGLRDFLHFVECAIQWSDEAGAESLSDPSKNSFRLLDTFLSDTITSDILEMLVKRTSTKEPLRVLVVDPNCHFARARAASIGQDAHKETRNGLINLLSALSSHLGHRVTLAQKQNIKTLTERIHRLSEKCNLSLRFYNETPSGPMYFLKDILLLGRFCAGQSSNRLPWSMIVDDPTYNHDIYDIHSREFEQIWSDAYSHPSGDLPMHHQDVPIFDLALVTATDREMNAVKSLPGTKWQIADSPKSGSLTFYSGEYSKGNRTLSLLATQQAEMGMVSAAITTTRLLDLFRCRYLGNVGICAALSNKAAIGNILIGSHLFQYQAGKLLNGKFKTDGDFIGTDLSLISALRRKGAACIKRADEAWLQSKPESRPKVVVGKIATGTLVVADAEYVRKEISPLSRKCIGIDMEGYSVMRAVAETAPDVRPKAVFAKAASDLANRGKDDSYQDYCSFISAHFVVDFVFDCIKNERE